MHNKHTCILAVHVDMCAHTCLRIQKREGGALPAALSEGPGRPARSLCRTTSRWTSCAESCRRIRQSTASPGWPPTPAPTPCPVLWTTCPSPRRCTARATSNPPALASALALPAVRPRPAPPLLPPNPRHPSPGLVSSRSLEPSNRASRDPKWRRATLPAK